MSAAIDLIYEAALAQDEWPRALRALCDLSGSASGSIVVFHGGHRPSTASTGPVGGVLEDLMAREDWLASYSVTRVLSAGPAQFLYDADFFPADMLEGDPLRRPILRQYGLGGQTATMLRLATGENVIFTFEHALESPRPDARALTLLDGLRSHLGRAALTSAQLRLRSARDAVAALQTLGMPAAAIDRQARVLATNPGFQALAGVLRIGARDRLSLAHPAAQALLSEAITLQGTGRAVRSFPVQAEDAEGEPLVVVLHILPLRRSSLELFGPADLLLLASVAAPGAAGPGPAVLESLFDLTPAEARLAAALGAGLSLREAAARCGIRFSSARTCLERIFRKTGSNRQPQLVAILRSAHPFRGEA